VPETNLAVALARFLSIPIAQPSDAPLERVLPDLIEAGFVRHNRVLPLGLHEGVLAVGVTDHFNVEPVNALAFATNLTIDVRLFVPADFDRVFNALYAGDAGNVEGRAAGGLEANELDVQRLRDLASEAPVIRLVNQVIADAVEAHASDIHIGSIGGSPARGIDSALRKALPFHRIHVSVPSLSASGY